MKTTLVLLNLVSGILILLLGAAAFLSLTNNPLAAVVGVVAVTLAAVCLWLASEYVVRNPKPTA